VVARQLRPHHWENIQTPPIFIFYRQKSFDIIDIFDMFLTMKDNSAEFVAFRCPRGLPVQDHSLTVAYFGWATTAR
jgi:hypothetical protein